MSLLMLLSIWINIGLVFNVLWELLQLKMTARGRRKSPEQDAVDHIILGKDKPIVEEKLIDTFKGKLLVSYHVLTLLTVISQQL